MAKFFILYFSAACGSNAIRQNSRNAMQYNEDKKIVISHMAQLYYFIQREEVKKLYF